MGNEPSKKKKAKTGTVPRVQNPSQARSIDGVKHILLVHNSNTPEEVKTVKNFRDALIQAAPGSIKVTKLVNVAEGSENLRDTSWLDGLNNVILIRLNTECVNHLANILRRYKFVDENNHLHDRILAISFGKTIPAGWPPTGKKRQVADQRDFVFGLDNEETLRPKDFNGPWMNSLVNAIMATR